MTAGDHAYLVRAPLTEVIVRAPTSTAARERVLAMTGYSHKPYLAREWLVRRATHDEIRDYAARAAAHHKSQPTAKQAARRTAERIANSLV